MILVNIILFKSNKLIKKITCVFFESRKKLLENDKQKNLGYFIKRDSRKKFIRK